MDNQALESGYEEHEENCANMTWILNKGWSVGKKMLISGAVISSTPLVLPLLMVISTMGLFCAVPCSFFLACYFCTKKLIATLLPSPKALPAIYEDSKEKDNYEEYGGDADVAKEEEELRHRVDMRLEQDEKENGEGVRGKDEIVEKNAKPNEERQGDATDVAIESGKRDDSEANEKPVKEKNEERTDRNVKESVAQSGNGDGGNTDETQATHVKRNQETVTQSGNDKGGNTKETKANRGKKNRKAKSADASDKQKEGNKKSDPEVSVPSNVDSPGQGGTASKE